MLKDLQFDWAPHDQAWEKGFLAFKHHIARTGDPNIPSGLISDGIDLGKWVRLQRSNRTRQPPTPERKKLLDDLNFIWDLPRHEWEAAFSKLVKFFNHNGHANPPDKAKIDGFGIGGWCYRQRKKKDDLEKWQIEKLNSLKFNW